LLPWGDTVLINHVTRVIQASKINDLVVVLGYKHEKIMQAYKNPANTIFNHGWKNGKSAAIKQGLTSVAAESEAAIFFSVDQPFISSELINSLINCAEETKSTIVATRMNGITTVPMLFTRALFPQFAILEGEEGGRKLLNNPQNTVEILDSKDERILIDIDSETDYKSALAADTWKNSN